MKHRQQNIIYAIENYSKRLFKFIRNRVKNDEDAEDILQDVWCQFVSVFDTEPIEQISSWLYRVSRNKIIDKNRKQTPLLLDDFAYEDEEGELIYKDELLTDNVNPEIILERAFLKKMFLKALDELPEKQKQVFVWNEMHDITLREIADVTGEKLKTIISRKQYAVKYLRQRLEKIYNEY